MLSKMKLYSFAASTAAIALMLAAAMPQRADAQERKSIRWTTSQVGSYGYTIAASMVKMAEQALGGQYTITVQPYQSPTVAMKAVMNGEGEIAYTADIGMTQFQERVGPLVAIPLADALADHEADLAVGVQDDGRAAQVPSALLFRALCHFRNDVEVEVIVRREPP